MKKHEVFSKLLKVKEDVQVIKNYNYQTEAIEKYATAQRNIQENMAQIVDDLLAWMFQSVKEDEPSITDEVYGAYVPGEDKTVVFHNVYVNGELIVSQLVGWYCGEPDAEATKSYGKSNSTAYYFD